MYIHVYHRAEWHHPHINHFMLDDEDLSSIKNKDWRRINTLEHYNVPDGANMTLLPRTSAHVNTLKSPRTCYLNGLATTGRIKSSDIYGSLKRGPARFGHSGSRVSLENMLALLPQTQQSPQPDAASSNLRRYHLLKRDHSGSAMLSSTKSISISEIYLTRLLSTKGILQHFVDDMMEAIVSANKVPIAVKFLFDYLDSLSRLHNIPDPDVVYTWKSNSLPLRFWVNVMKNPDFIFDINKSPLMDSCLSVVAQTLMDSCSTSSHPLGKDSPSNKLLFARDIPRYRKLVQQFYADIRHMPSLDDHTLQKHFVNFSQTHDCKRDIESALQEFVLYFEKYGNEVLEEMDNSDKTRSLVPRIRRIVQSVGRINNSETSL